MTKEMEILRKYLKQKKQNVTPQRMEILTVFLETESHINSEELYELVRGKNKKIGRATVYRSLKLFKECGLAREVHFENDCLRYEHQYNHRHHDHLICLECGASVEFFNSDIEKLQNQIARKYGFEIVDHNQELFGYCSKCQQRRRQEGV